MTIDRLRSAVVRFLVEPHSADFLSFYRIATAAMGVLTVVLIFPAIGNIYGPEGFIQWVVNDELFRIPTLPSLIQIADLFAPLGVSGNTVVYSAFVLYTASLIGMLLGWHTRISIGIAWVMHLLIMNTSIIFGYGVETFLRIGLFYCLIGPSAERWSLDARAGRTGAHRVSGTARLVQRIIQVHLCIVYFNAGISKMLGSDWWNGEAIWRSVMQPNYMQADFSWMAWWPSLTLVLGLVTLLVEAGYPLFIWLRRTRLPWLALTIALHAGIALFMGLWMFASMMIIMNIAGFGWDSIKSMKLPVWREGDRAVA